MYAPQIRDLIIETMEEVELHSRNAEELVLLTAAVETNLGQYIKQNPGPALGMFQTEPLTHDDIMHRWLSSRPISFQTKINNFLSKYTGDIRDASIMRFNLKYSILVVRLFYYRKPEPIPDYRDVAALAAYWKRHYNTAKGGGTVEDAIQKYHKYVTSRRLNE